MNRGHVLLTGALGGLGTAIAKTLIDREHRVVACDRRAQDLAAWLEGFSAAERERITFHPLDVRDLGRAEALRDELA
ncbi:MAG: SDR family NAD(P)-dependent oxidoreductase [Myxococcales bacterium]|nr:SDR family NAD(P)-dependent oxidoreductase [Myxococcales bacterium]